ncbi:MAG: hypothetical protein JO309_14210 [Pseudonocardiales bacterium]|nr:hypothetical protein [Pseudonocardiales bacterium]MBV9730526.1 hypothetical protein [Pseudonocardiales bacterium]
MPQDGGGEWVSRRVGELALEQVRVGRPGGAPHALNELDAPPLTCYASGADATGYPPPW